MVVGCCDVFHGGSGSLWIISRWCWVFLGRCEIFEADSLIV